jgi:hypothetical protein
VFVFKRWTLVVVLVAALSYVGSAFADYNYVDGQTMSPTQTSYSTWNYWTINKVWRPTVNLFCVWFAPHSGWQSGEVCNSSDNPFASSGSYGYNQGYCSSGASSDVNPVTCRVYS